MSKSKNFQYPRTVMFDEETLAQAKALTDKGRLSLAHVVRTSVASRYRMEIEQRPTCANGNACHCPHTHTFQPR